MCELVPPKNVIKMPKDMCILHWDWEVTNILFDETNHIRLDLFFFERKPTIGGANNDAFVVTEHTRCLVWKFLDCCSSNEKQANDSAKCFSSMRSTSGQKSATEHVAAT